MLVAQGNLNKALAAFREGLAIAERLTRADPDNAGWRRDLGGVIPACRPVRAAGGGLEQRAASLGKRAVDPEEARQ